MNVRVESTNIYLDEILKNSTEREREDDSTITVSILNLE